MAGLHARRGSCTNAPISDEFEIWDLRFNDEGKFDPRVGTSHTRQSPTGTGAGT